MLLSALSWGRLCGDPVHNEVRPDVGAAIYSSVSPKEGHRLTRSHQRPDVSGAGHRSSSVLFLPSVGSDPQRRSFYPATRSPTFCLCILSLKRSPLLKPPTIERCAKAGRPHRLPRDGEAVPQAYGRPLLWLVSWRSCHHVQRSSLRGVVSPSQERTVPGYSGRCLLEAV